MATARALLVASLVLSCFLLPCYGTVLFSSLQGTLVVTASPTSQQVLKAGVDKITVTWGVNQTLPAGTDSSYKTIRVKLCYARISQVDRPWRKTVDLLKRTGLASTRSLLDRTAPPTEPPSPSTGLLRVTCRPPRTSYEPMLTTPMTKRWLSGKQQMQIRPPICSKSKQSVDATPQLISAPYASVFSPSFPCLVSSTTRRGRLTEENRAKDIVSQKGSIKYCSSGFHVYFLKPSVLC
ncbi:HIGH-AFFINITY NITRATE TRANSPORTER 3.2 [Salix purpurea]|uniref:HIGH-AFFINITY NITRATE TRANSPORTER 3.2 n=1 Tax=Salix purpurea TaxID=77065 RepID=A0A9Q0V861_SALPP|nr:HIGH-AFFINITY NITRATE TRANSPORTER 3.2 [Salix purpurea]